ncbi:MAG: hypothetical protein AAF829_00910 [Pseudomonadota bacterium]
MFSPNRLASAPLTEASATLGAGRDAKGPNAMMFAPQVKVLPAKHADESIARRTWRRARAKRYAG